MACNREPECKNDTEPGTRYISRGPAAIVFSVDVAHGSVPFRLPPGLYVPELLGRPVVLLVNLTILLVGCVKSVSTPSVAPMSTAVEGRFEALAEKDRFSAALRVGCSGVLGTVVDMLATRL